MSSGPTTSSFLDILPTRHLSASSEPSNLQSLLEEAVKKYEEQTGTSLIEDQLAIQLRTCDDVESIVKLLEEGAQAFREFRGDDRHPKIKGSIKRVVHVLHTVFTGPSNSLSGGAVQVGHGIASVVCLNPLKVSIFLVPMHPL
jgi:fungal STAND N-terminal Goodbye domain